MVWRRCQEIDQFRLFVFPIHYHVKIPRRVFCFKVGYFLFNEHNRGSLDLYWENRIDKRKRSIRGICMEFELKARTLILVQHKSVRLSIG